MAAGLALVNPMHRASPQQWLITQRLRDIKLRDPLVLYFIARVFVAICAIILPSLPRSAWSIIPLIPLPS